MCVRCRKRSASAYWIPLPSTHLPWRPKRKLLLIFDLWSARKSLIVRTHLSASFDCLYFYLPHEARCGRRENPRDDGNKMFHSRNKTIPAHCQNKPQTHFTVSFFASDAGLAGELSKKARARSAASDSEGAFALCAITHCSALCPEARDVNANIFAKISRLRKAFPARRRALLDGRLFSFFSPASTMESITFWMQTEPSA